MAENIVPIRPIFDSARVLLYNIYPWNELGIGVPNFGRQIGTLSSSIWKLVDEIGEAQLFIMTRDDARRKQPPSANTIGRIAKLINRVQAVLAGRAKSYPDSVLEAGHAEQNPKVWNIHPAPYFEGPLVVNGWLNEYNELVM